MGIDFQDPTTWDEDITEEDALSVAIFGLNTLLHPDGSSDADVAALDFFGEGAIDKLVARRDRIRNDDGTCLSCGEKNVGTRPCLGPTHVTVQDV
jgi:hypothetical protein